MDGAWWLIGQLNTSKLLLALTSITLNLGSRFLIGELTPAQSNILRHPIAKRIVIFCMFFMVTRDVRVALPMCVVTVICLEALFNERSRFCVIPQSRGSNSPLPVLPGPMPAPVVKSMLTPMSMITSPAHPATAHPATANPATAHPATDHPTNASPATANPATAHPATAHPTIANPATANPATAHQCFF